MQPVKSGTEIKHFSVAEKAAGVCGLCVFWQLHHLAQADIKERAYIDELLDK